MRKVFTIPHQCPECHAKINTTFTVGGATGHEPGEIMLCTHCGGLSIFDEKTALKKATDEDMKAFRGAYPWLHVDLISRQAAIRSDNQLK